MPQLEICWVARRNETKIAFKWLLLFAGMTCCGLGNGGIARSQIIPDGTLPLPTAVTCIAVTCNITNGTTSGNTLFHSFSQFSPQAGTFAIFRNNNPAIQNIISRVTGTLPSQIEGFIAAGGTSPNFNLFLINPNGIIFGRNAALNLNGSFFATTASSIQFENGTEFGINTSNPPILTVNVPVGLQFGPNPSSIQVLGNGMLSPSLSVPAGNTFALVGGDVEMQGGSAIASRGRLEIGGVGSNNLVNLKPSPTGFALDYSSVRGYRDIRLSQGAGGLADASPIQVRGRRVSLTGGAALAAVPTFTKPGGNIDVYGSESVEISGVSGAPLFANSGLYAQNQGSSTNAGNITVTTPDLKILDGGIVINSTSGTGQAGDITINASRVELRGLPQRALFPDFTGLRSVASAIAPGAGSGGNITVNSQELIVTEGAGITAFTQGPGQAGNVSINNARSVEISGRQSFISTDTTIGSGIAGNVRIDTEQLYVTNAAQIRSRSEGSGSAGNIEIVNADIVSLDRGGQILAEATGSGNAGNIDVDARIVWLDNAATLSAENRVESGGSIALRNLQLLNLNNNSEISASTVNGRGGTSEVNAGWINLDNNSRILSRATGLGNSGNIALTAERLTLNNGSQVAANHTGVGQAGDVTLFAGQLNLDNGSQVTVSHGGLGNAGNLIAIADNINLSNQSQLSSATQLARGGNIDLQGRTLNLNNSTISAETRDGTGGTVSIRATNAIALNNNSRFLASATGNGNAGSLEVSARQIELRDRAQIASETRDGTGGNITLRDWQTLSLDNQSQVSASTANGQGGTVNITGFGNLTLNNNSNLLANATETGNAGNLEIDIAGKLNIQNDSEATVRNLGTGDAGNLSVSAADIFLSQRGRLAASTAAGNGGNIDLRVDNSIVLRFNSEISAEAGGRGNGGNMVINAGGLILGVLSENSDVVANAFQGNGGNITATALAVFTFRQFQKQRTPESDFIASSQVGIDGTVIINAREQPQFVPLPNNFLNTQFAEGCDVLTQNAIGLRVLGRRGLIPDPPVESLSSDGIWEDLRNSTESSSRPSRSEETVVEAKGWMVNDRGNVVLVSEFPKPSGSRCAVGLGL